MNDTKRVIQVVTPFSGFDIPSAEIKPDSVQPMGKLVAGAMYTAFDEKVLKADVMHNAVRVAVEHIAQNMNLEADVNEHNRQMLATLVLRSALTARMVEAFSPDPVQGLAFAGTWDGTMYELARTELPDDQVERLETLLEGQVEMATEHVKPNGSENTCACGKCGGNKRERVLAMTGDELYDSAPEEIKQMAQLIGQLSGRSPQEAIKQIVQQIAQDENAEVLGQTEVDPRAAATDESFDELVASSVRHLEERIGHKLRVDQVRAVREQMTEQRENIGKGIAAIAIKIPR